MKNYCRYLIAFAFMVALVSCNEQSKMTGPEEDGNAQLDDIGMLKGTAATKPTISSLSPASAEIGDLLTVFGSNFGATRASGSNVSVKGVPVTVYTNWTNTAITVVVPSGSLTGPGLVTVRVGNSVSRGKSFTLLPSSPITIGTQVWMGADLDVTTYRNGDPIPQVTDPTAWVNLTTGAWCYSNNDPVTGQLYGKLYNWYAVNDPRGLAPQGWHVPSETEWKTLFIHLGMSPQDADGWGYPPNAYYGTNEGGMLKEAGTSLWNSPNTGATNSTGFTALPGGYRGTDGSFQTYYTGRSSVGWWAATEYNAERAWMRMVVSYQADTYHNNLVKHMGWSVRCIQGN